MRKAVLPFSRSLPSLTFAAAFAASVHAAGGPGFALRFLGSGDFVSVPSANALNAYPLTVTAWFTTTQSAGQPAGMITKSPAGGFDGWQVSLAGGNIYAAYFAGGGNYVWTGPYGLNGGPVANGMWHHVAFAVDATGGRLYVDGVLQSSLAWTGTPGATTSLDDMRMGAFSGGGVLFDGMVDEVTVWNVALTQAQIQANKNRSLTGNETGLVAYYRCDEGVGSFVGDSAPAGGDNRGTWTSVGNFSPSDVQPFTPFAQTQPATPVTAIAATLNGLTNPEGTNTSAWFEWGTTTNYGTITPAQMMGSGSFNAGFSEVVTGLLGGATYHFRAAASNSLGAVFDIDRSFTTPVFYPVDAGLPVSRGAISFGTWGDYDNDGRLDLLLAGSTFVGTNVSPFVEIWRNTGSGFSNINAGLPALRMRDQGRAPGPAVWDDYDNDGRLDLVMTGALTNQPGYALQIWRNTGSGFSNTLQLLGNTLNEIASQSSAAWGDFNSDGKSDLVLNPWYLAHIGQVYHQPYATIQVWPNTGNGFASGAGLILDNLFEYGWGLAPADYDNDGRLDILVLGRTNDFQYGGYVTQVWRNTGNGFTDINAGLPPTSFGSVAWGDYDNDGRLDILLAGPSGTNGITQIWRNTGNGFSNIQAALPGFGVSGADATVAWGDYDNDGRPDILLVGRTNVSPEICQIWRNTGNGFTKIDTGFGESTNNILSEAVHFAAWADYDNDGRLDLLLLRETNAFAFSGYLAQLWRNNTPAANTPPAAPTGLTVSNSPNAVTFSWNAATDAQTPSSGLNYNLRVGTTPGGGDLVGPVAASSGLRPLLKLGNAYQNLSRTIYNLPFSRPIYWSVQAIDTAYAGSPFAVERSFGVYITPPNGLTNGNSTLGDANGDGIVDQAELNTVLSNYFPHSPWLYMTNVAGLGGTNVSFALSNSTAGAFSVEFSTNLFDWSFLGPATPRYLFNDTNAPNDPQRYYRLRWP